MAITMLPGPVGSLTLGIIAGGKFANQVAQTKALKARTETDKINAAANTMRAESERIAAVSQASADEARTTLNENQARFSTAQYEALKNKSSAERIAGLIDPTDDNLDEREVAAIATTILETMGDEAMKDDNLRTLYQSQIRAKWTQMRSEQLLAEQEAHSRSDYYGSKIEGGAVNIQTEMWIDSLQNKHESATAAWQKVSTRLSTMDSTMGPAFVGLQKAEKKAKEYMDESFAAIIAARLAASQGRHVRQQTPFVPITLPSGRINPTAAPTTPSAGGLGPAGSSSGRRYSAGARQTTDGGLVYEYSGSGDPDDQVNWTEVTGP